MVSLRQLSARTLLLLGLVVVLHFTDVEAGGGRRHWVRPYYGWSVTSTSISHTVGRVNAEHEPATRKTGGDCVLFVTNMPAVQSYPLFTPEVRGGEEAKPQQNTPCGRKSYATRRNLQCVARLKLKGAPLWMDHPRRAFAFGTLG